MTGLNSTAQSERVMQSAIRDLTTPQLVTRRCIDVDSDKIVGMTADEWRAFVAEKYGEES